MKDEELKKNKDAESENDSGKVAFLSHKGFFYSSKIFGEDINHP